jgi:hypothetical protein
MFCEESPYFQFLLGFYSSLSFQQNWFHINRSSGALVIKEKGFSSRPPVIGPVGPARAPAASGLPSGRPGAGPGAPAPTGSCADGNRATFWKTRRSPRSRSGLPPGLDRRVRSLARSDRAPDRAPPAPTELCADCNRREYCASLRGSGHDPVCRPVWTGGSGPWSGRTGPCAGLSGLWSG